MSIASKKYDERFAVAKYKALIKTPATGAFTLPANGKFAVKSTAGNIANATALTLAGYHSTQSNADPLPKPTPGSTRTVKVPLLAAGKMYKIGNLQRAAVVTMSVGFELWVHTGLGVYKKVGAH